MPEGDRTYDVAVVGFGPVGAVAAGLFGGYGLSCFVCDRARDIYDKPRAIALDHEILRVFQQLGVLQRIEPFIEPFTDSLYYGVDGRLIRRMSTVAPPYPLGFAPSVVFSQPPVERILREHAAALPSVDIALGMSLTGLVQDAQGVTLALRGDDGETRTVRARFLIACDGASSTARELVGIGLEDLGFDEPWLVVDVLVNATGLARLPPFSVQYCEPDRPCSFIIGAGNHRRWEISINDGEDPALTATPERTWQLLARWIGPEHATLWRQASYRFHALVAGQWRAGRVFVAGDAAHQQPPFLGQGLCQGVRDVANLAWKISAVLRDEAADTLLDTYGIERKQHVTDLTTRIRQVGRLIGERDPVRARARDAQLLADCGGEVKPVPRQNMQPALTGGLLDPGSRAGAGTLFPQPWIVRDGGRHRMDTLAGTGWRLVARQPMGALPDVTTLPPGAQVLQMDSPGFAEDEGVLAAWFAEQQCEFALVRPDHYVYGVANDARQLGVMLDHLHQRMGV